MSAAKVGAILGTLLLAMGVVSPVLGGWASDFAARRNAMSGRLKLASAAFAIQFALGAATLLLRGLEPTLAVLAINSLVSSCLAASALVVLQESGPPQVRGQSVAIYLVATNVIGMGLGPLLVALLTLVTGCAAKGAAPRPFPTAPRPPGAAGRWGQSK